MTPASLLQTLLRLRALLTRGLDLGLEPTHRLTQFVAKFMYHCHCISMSLCRLLPKSCQSAFERPGAPVERDRGKEIVDKENGKTRTHECTKVRAYRQCHPYCTSPARNCRPGPRRSGIGTYTIHRLGTCSLRLRVRVVYILSANIRHCQLPSQHRSSCMQKHYVFLPKPC